MRTRKYDVECGLISKLIQTKDYQYVTDQQIRSSFFTGDNFYVYKFIEDYYIEHSSIPTPRVLEMKFSNYTFDTVEVNGVSQIGTEENMSHWCAEVRRKTKHNHIVDIISDITEGLSTLDTEEAYEKLKQGLYYIENEVQLSTDIDITTSAEKRKEIYLKRKENKGMLGIPYGIPLLDYLTKGLENGTLTTLIAKTGVGKTWFQILVGAYAQLNNYHVLQCVTEMSEDIMRDRYEAMLYSMTCGEFNYNNFKSGALTLQQEREYFRFLDEELPYFEPLIIHTAVGVPSIQARAESVNADLIMIDGAYLMSDTQNARDDWLRVTHITRDLKLMAKKLKRPVFINSQADKSTSKLGPEMENISYAQSIGMDSDVVLALFRDEIMRNDHEMGIKVLKQREGMLGKVLINWDMSRMNFEQIYSVDEQGKSSAEDEKPEDTKNVVGLGSRRRIN